MRRRMVWAVLCCFLLSGCQALPFPRELEDTVLVRALGMDWTAGEVALTAADIPGEGGGQARLLTARGQSLAESKQMLREQGEESVSLTCVTQIVVGQDSDLRAVLEGVLGEREIGQSATVWLCETGSAQALMEQVGGGAKRLNSMELNMAALPTRTVLEALAALEEDGEVTLPVLRVEGETLVLAPERAWKEEP